MPKPSEDPKPFPGQLEPLHQVEVRALTEVPSGETTAAIRLDGVDLRNVKSWRLEQAGPRRVPELTVTLLADVAGLAGFSHA